MKRIKNEYSDYSSSGLKKPFSHEEGLRKMNSVRVQ